MFERLYEAHSKRKAIERCNAVKDAIIAGVWGNTNYDPQKEGEEAPRRAILESIEEQFQKAIREIHSGVREKDEAEIDWDNPFFAASKAPRIGQPPVGTPDTQESRERDRLLDELDQT